MNSMHTGPLDASRTMTKAGRDCLKTVELTRLSSRFQASESTVESENSSDCAEISGIGSDTKCQPPLLTLLPFEIRRKIWNDVLGGTAYHLGLNGQPVVRAWLCLSPDPSTCDGFDCYTKRTKVKSKKSLKTNLISVPLTCRQM